MLVVIVDLLKAPNSFTSANTIGDYHSEMDANNFTKYIQEKLIPNLPTNSILVLDNAPYHSRQIDKPLTPAADFTLRQQYGENDRL